MWTSTSWVGTKGKESKSCDKEARTLPTSTFDIWGAISYKKAIAVDIQNSDDRKRKKVRGYGKKDVKLFLRKKVAPQVAKMKHDGIVSMDRGFHFKPDEIEEELKKGGAKNIEDVWISPPNAEIMWSTRQYSLALDERKSSES